MIRDEAARGPDLPLVHDRDGRAAALRPRLRLPRRRASSPTSPRAEMTEEKVLHASFRDRRVSALLARTLPARALLPAALAGRCCSPRSSGCSRATMSYFGLNLLLNLAVPIALATIAQMFMHHASTTSTSRSAPSSASSPASPRTWLHDTPLLGHAALAGCVAAYAAIGALIQLRQLPSIVVTLGMSFVWLGLAVLVLPTPGGKAPDWLRALMTLKPPCIPLPDPRRGRHRRSSPTSA